MVKNNKKLYKKLSIACITLGLITSSLVGGKMFKIINEERESFKKIEDFKMEMTARESFENHKEYAINSLNEARDLGLLSYKEYDEKVSKIDTIDYFYANRSKYLNPANLIIKILSKH